MSNPNVATGPGFASREEAHEEAVNRYPDVIRIAAGLAANPSWMNLASSRILAGDDWAALLAADSLGVVIACEVVCGIGGDA